MKSIRVGIPLVWFLIFSKFKELIAKHSQVHIFVLRLESGISLAFTSKIHAIIFIPDANTDRGNFH